LKRLPGAQVSEALQMQMPPQSAPPWFGSQSSLGSSMQVPEPGHGKPAMPPQNGGRGAHSPRWLTATPALAAKHGFEYVLPSHPHTGSN